MSQQFPVSQQQIYFKQEECSSQGQNNQGCRKAESNLGVESAVVGCREEEAD